MPNTGRIDVDQIIDQSNWSEWIGQALKNLGSSLMLEENPLAHHPFADKLAQRKYSRRFSPSGSALRELLLTCISEVISETEEESALYRENQYLKLWMQGLNVTQIARELEVTREHCSQTVRRRVIQMLVAKFAVVSSMGAKNHPRV